MAETRTALTEKLEALEERVRGTVEGAQSTGEDLLENVKGTVAETADAVKETLGQAQSSVAGMVENVKDTLDETATRVQQSFDLRYQVDQHPWVMLSGAVVIGYLLGGLGTRNSAWSYRTPDAWSGPEEKRRGYVAATTPSPAENLPSTASQSRTPPSRLWESTVGQFKEEFDLLKGAAIGALLNTVREMATQSWPAIAPQVEKAIDSATAKVSGHPRTNGERQEQQGVELARERRE